MKWFRPECQRAVEKAGTCALTLSPELYRRHRQDADTVELAGPRHITRTSNGNLYCSGTTILYRVVLKYPAQVQPLAGSHTAGSVNKDRCALKNARFTSLGGVAIIDDNYRGRLELLVCDTGSKALVSVHVQFNSDGGSATISTTGSWASPVSLSKFDSELAFLDACRMDDSGHFAFTAADSRGVFLAKLKSARRERLDRKVDSPAVPVCYRLTLVSVVKNDDVLYRPVCLAWKEATQVYVTDCGSDDVKVRAKPGVKIVSFTAGGAVDVLCDSKDVGVPFGISVCESGTGDVIVSDMAGDRLVRIDEKLQATTLAGGHGRRTVDGSGHCCQFNQPKGITTHGNALFVVCGDNSLRLFSPLKQLGVFMATARKFAQTWGILDPRERRHADLRALRRNLSWVGLEAELAGLAIDRDAWFDERRADLRLKADAKAMKGPEGIVPYSTLKAWQLNLRSVCAISTYLTDAGLSEYIAGLRPSQMHSMNVELIYADQALSAFERKQNMKSYINGCDTNRFEKIKRRTTRHFAAVTSDRPFYFSWAFGMTEEAIRASLREDTRLSERTARKESEAKEGKDRERKDGEQNEKEKAPASMLKVFNIVKRQPEMRLRDVYKRKPQHHLYITSIDPLPGGDPNIKDYLLSAGMCCFCCARR